MLNREAWLNVVVDSLPPLERAVINCLFYERLSERDTAEVMHLDWNEVRALRRRAFKRVRALYAALEVLDAGQAD